MDSETYKQATEGERFQRIVESEAYAELKSLITQKIMDLQSIMNIDAGSPEAAVMDLKARRAAIEILLETLRDIEGRADQHKSNKALIQESYILNV